MAARTGFQVEGAKALRRDLKRAGVKVSDLSATHRTIANRVVEEARRRAPVRTGKLRSSLKPSGTQASAIILSSGRSVPYAAPIHWGWPSRHIRANPFVLEAAEATHDEWTADYLQALETIIQTVNGGKP